MQHARIDCEKGQHLKVVLVKCIKKKPCILCRRTLQILIEKITNVDNLILCKVNMYVIQLIVRVARKRNKQENIVCGVMCQRHSSCR